MSDSESHDAIRHFRSELVQRLSRPAIESLCDRLFANRIVSLEESNSISSQRREAEEQQARAMLDILQKREKSQKVQFVTMLCETDGLCDLGQRMTEWQEERRMATSTIASIADRQSAVEQKLTSENCELQTENKKLKTENRALKVENSEQKTRLHDQKKSQNLLIEHGLRKKVDAFGDGHVSYMGSSCMQSTPLKSPLKIGNTANCVTCVSDGNLFAASWASRNLYSLDLSMESSTWISVLTVLDGIWNVFSWNDQCCVRIGQKNKIYCYLDEKWKFLADMPSTLRIVQGSASLVANGNRIYRLGGYNGDCLNVASFYDLENQKQWNDLPNMPFSSRWCSSAVDDNLLYVAGGCVDDGRNGWNPIRNIAVLDVRSRDWRLLSPLEHYNATIASLGCNIVACGGCNERKAYDNDHSGKDVSVLDVRSGHWLPLSSTLNRHSYSGMCATSDEQLVVVAGKDSNEAEFLSYSN